MACFPFSFLIFLVFSFLFPFMFGQVIQPNQLSCQSIGLTSCPIRLFFFLSLFLSSFTSSSIFFKPSWAYFGLVGPFSLSFNPSLFSYFLFLFSFEQAFFPPFFCLFLLLLPLFLCLIGFIYLDSSQYILLDWFADN